jgi:hypothetical protein
MCQSQHRQSQDSARHLADKMGTPPKNLPWTDKFCHFVRFGMAEGQGLRAKGKKDSNMHLPEVAIPSLSPQPLPLSRSASCVMYCLNSHSPSRQEIRRKSMCERPQLKITQGHADLGYGNPEVVSYAPRENPISRLCHATAETSFVFQFEVFNLQLAICNIPHTGPRPSASLPALTSPHPRVRLVLSHGTLRSPV